jgi:hypothetical protein
MYSLSSGNVELPGKVLIKSSIEERLLLDSFQRSIQPQRASSHPKELHPYTAFDLTYSLFFYHTLISYEKMIPYESIDDRLPVNIDLCVAAFIIHTL